jgi:hypothetical protein
MKTKLLLCACVVLLSNISVAQDKWDTPPSRLRLAKSNEDDIK